MNHDTHNNHTPNGANNHSNNNVAVPADLSFYDSLKQDVISDSQHDIHSSPALASKHEHHESHTEVTHTPSHDHHNDSHHTEHAEEEEKEGSKLIKIIVVIGILVLLFFISIGIVRFVPKAIGSLSSASVYLSDLFSNDGVSLSFKEAQVASGDDLTISWKNTSKTAGDLVWSFACTEGITVMYSSVDGKKLPVVCETWFPLSKEASAYAFLVNSKNETTTKVSSTLALFSTSTKEIITSDAKEFSVTGLKEDTKEEAKEVVKDTPAYNPNQTGVAITETKTETKTENTTENNPQVNQTVTTGPTDLSIILVQANAIKAGTINVGPLSSVGLNDKVYLRFKIKNNGSKRSEGWKLTTELPTRTAADKYYTSRIQSPLNPSGEAELTMVFDSYDMTSRQIKIAVDLFGDTNQSNNILLIPISPEQNGDYSNTGSRADLSVRILDVGIQTGYNGFRSTTNLSTDDRIGVKFEVTNRGSVASDYYDIEIKFPTQDNELITFESRSPLMAGQRSEFTVFFDNPDEGRGEIEIQVDSSDDVRENSETNNDASRTINVD